MWVNVFYNVRKHFQVYVATLPVNKVSTLLLVNLSHKLLHPKIPLFGCQKSEVGGQRSEVRGQMILYF